jgi:hypothetical protein
LTVGLAYVVHVVVDIVGVAALLSKHRRLERFVAEVSVLFGNARSIVHVDILRILHALFWL